jgi:hypothetical protein
MIRSLRVARQTAMRARTQTINALKALLVTAPPELREQLRGLSTPRLVRTAAALEPGPISSPLAAAMLALCILADRYQALSAEIGSLTTELNRLTDAAPKLMALFGIGADSPGALLVAAGDNPGPLRNDACFAMLCGASPIQASSGKTTRHRLNRGGDRQATRRCTGSWSSGCAGTNRPRPTWTGASPGEVAKGDHPLPEAVRGPRGLHSPPPDRPGCPYRSRLTAIRASQWMTCGPRYPAAARSGHRDLQSRARSPRPHGRGRPRG